MVSRPVRGPVQVTGDTASHAQYGVDPATDYGVGAGTPVLAPFAGDVSWSFTSTGGNTVAVDQGDTQFYGQHLSTPFRDGFSGRADEKQQIALSGNSGTPLDEYGVGGEYEPHLHCWVVVLGQRMSFEEYIAYAGGTPVPIWESTPAGTSTAGGDSRPAPTLDPSTEGNTMAIVLLKASTASGAGTGKGTFCLYDPSAVEPAARWQEFSEYPIARALVDALHSKQNSQNAGSAVVLPDYAWDVWKQRALGKSSIPPK